MFRVREELSGVKFGGGSHAPRGGPLGLSPVWIKQLTQSFPAKVEGTEKGRAYIVLPFRPEKVWGLRPRYHVTGTINEAGVRGPLEPFARGYLLPLGPVWRRDNGVRVGDSVTVVLSPEGPQSEALAADIQAALEGEPEAARFFDGLATFYRKGYLRWIDATKRSPEMRAQRIAAFVEWMKAGKKARGLAGGQAVRPAHYRPGGL